MKANTLIFEAVIPNTGSPIGIEDGEDETGFLKITKHTHTGSRNQHKIVALSKTREFRSWTMTNRDLEFLGLRDLLGAKVNRQSLSSTVRENCDTPLWNTTQTQSPPPPALALPPQDATCENAGRRWILPCEPPPAQHLL